MRWSSQDNGLTEDEKRTVEDLLPVMITMVNDEIGRFEFGYEFKSLLQAKAFAAAVEAVMQWEAAERQGKAFTLSIRAYAAECMKFTIIESIVKLFDQYEKTLEAKKNAGTFPAKPVQSGTPRRPRPNTDKPSGKNR